MIKFFRKIRQNLLSEGKMGKYFKYAIGEIVLVVIGILIALQINNLNDELKEKNNLISELKNAQTFIQSEIEKEEDEYQKILALRDTIQHALKIIEEADHLSPMDKKYLISSRTHITKVGLRIENVNTMYNLSVSLTNSKKESRHKLNTSINELIDFIKVRTHLEESFQNNILYLDGSVNKSAWRWNSKNEVIFDFNLMKNDYDLQFLFNRSMNYKRASASWTLRIIEKYKSLQKEIEDVLRELD